jgi:hypothetical protein
MTKTTSAQLDLGTINEVQQVVVHTIRNQVCDWEQKAHDAGLTGNWAAAQQYKEWAFAAELCASKASQVCTALFAETVSSLPVVTDYRTVQLPNLTRSSEDCRLDALAIEVASHQGAPTT